MAFTYDEANIATDIISQLRLKINDTTEPAQFSDEELQFLLDDAGGDIVQAARSVLTTIMLSASQQASRTTGQVSEDYSNIVSQIRSALKGLEEEEARNTDIPCNIYASGLFIADMEKADSNECLYQGISQHRR